MTRKLSEKKKEKLLLTLDEDHTYRYNGVIVPSVNQVLPKPDLHQSQWSSEILMDRGKDRHSLIKMFFDFKMKETFNEPLLIMLSDWFKKHKKMLGGLICYEKMFYSARYRFAGTPDMIFERATVDFKSSFYAPRLFSLSVEGYDILANENIDKKKRLRIVIYPGSDRKFEMKHRNVFDPRASKVFLGAVFDWHYKQALNNYLKG